MNGADDPGPLVGAVEAGGTKFVCALGTGPLDIRARTRFPTTTPEETLGRTREFFATAAREGALRGLGVGAFGPADVDPTSEGWGRITSTPKPGWSDTDVVGPLRRALGVPVAFDTDVNAAAIGEGRWGAARELDTFLYLTVGTGIGGGAVANGRVLHGLLHPEMGHIPVPHDRARDPYPGCCPFHGDCLEGLAAGPAIGERWGRPADELPDHHPAWDLEASYLGHALCTYALVLSPRRIIVGGGVMARSFLYDRVRRRFSETLGGYLRAPAIRDDLERFIVPPGLGARSGLLGALALGRLAAGEHEGALDEPC